MYASPTMGVDRKLASEFDCATGDEVLGLSPTAETEFLELHQNIGHEVVVENHRLSMSDGRSPLCDQS